MIKSLRGFWRLFRKPRGEERHVTEPSEATVKRSGSVSKLPESALIRVSREKVRIQVGLDFGTSSTKVAFSRYQRRRTQVVNFNHNLPFYPKYCLPSVAADRRGRLVLGAEAASLLMDEPWDSGFRRFKMMVAGNADSKYQDNFTEENFHKYRMSHGYDESLTPERITAVYVAYVMYQANRIISGMLEFSGSAIEFDFNICMPIDHIENVAVKMAFERIFKWAEAIYKIWLIREESLDPIKASSEFENNLESSEESRVFAVPEAVAEVASYLVSLRRKEGIHAIIDFGAGTTDISVFNYMNPFGEGKSTWYSARNIPQGTIEIEKKLKKHGNENDHGSKRRCSDVYRQLEGLKEYCESNNICKIACQIRDALTALRNSEAYFSAWSTAYRHLRKQTAFDGENVQLFVTGGGVNMPYIAPIFGEPFLPQLRGPYKVEVLPPPDDFDPGFIQAPFARVAVAYGLSIPIPALEEYVLPSQAPDHTPPPLPVLQLDRDEIYAK
jgi:hypothetical protein